MERRTATFKTNIKKTNPTDNLRKKPTEITHENYIHSSKTHIKSSSKLDDNKNKSNRKREPATQMASNNKTNLQQFMKKKNDINNTDLPDSLSHPFILCKEQNSLHAIQIGNPENNHLVHTSPGQ